MPLFALVALIHVRLFSQGVVGFACRHGETARGRCSSHRPFSAGQFACQKRLEPDTISIRGVQSNRPLIHSLPVEIGRRDASAKGAVTIDG